MTLSQTAPATTRWNLTAPESWVLMNGAKASAEPFKLALTELLMRGALRIVESKGRFNRKTILLVDGAKAQAPTDAALAPVWELYKGSSTKTTAEGTGVPVDQLAKAAQRKFGSVGGYVAKAVAPALQERGLITWTSKKVLFVFSSGSWELTRSGQAMKVELEALLGQGRENLPGWVSSDPTQAAAYLGTAGAAVLLAPTLFPQLRELGRVANVDFADYDFGSDFDVSALDSIDTAFDAIDSSVDSGSDSGSDSGGGSDAGSSGD